jgi:alpha-tubulin suppressor-like RCC1 family protein
VDIVRVAASCKRFRRGGLETVELPTESPVVAVLRKLAFPQDELIPRTRQARCSESWVSYLARAVRQRCCLEAPTVAAADQHSLFLDAAGQLLACGDGGQVGVYSIPTLVAALAGVRVRSVAAGQYHSLALSWDGRVYLWGDNNYGDGDIIELAPELVEGLEDVCSVSAAASHSFAVTQLGTVFMCGRILLLEAEDADGSDEDSEDSYDPDRPIIVKGFGGVRVRRACAGSCTTFAIGEAGELFSWGRGMFGLLGHGDEQSQRSPKRVEALRGIRVSTVSVGQSHALALTEDGLVYSCGRNDKRAVLGNLHVERELLPKPVELLRNVRVISVAASGGRSCAVADTGEV